LERPRKAQSAAWIVTLGADDAAAMVELTELTKPGPFTLRTHDWERFWEFGSMDGWLRWWASG
jgi:hypothetical protein